MLRREFDPGLLDRCFHPHAAAVTREVERMLEHHGRAVLVDLQSYPTVRLPYELAGPGDPRPQVCLGTDSVHTQPWLRDAAAEAFAGLDVALDSPFAGHLRPARHYGTDARVASVMIELRRDVYMDETEVRPLPGIEDVATRLARLLDTVAADRERTSPPRRPAMPVPSGA